VRLPRIVKRAAHRLGLHRIGTRPCDARVRVLHDGVTLAETGRAIRLDETGSPPRYYIPREDVRLELLTRSPTTSHCPFKGDATYWSAPGAQDAFWSYEAPADPEAQPIAGMLAPSPRRVEVRAG
jgi:uncharacterized protein (DUF427 family)